MERTALQPAAPDRTVFDWNGRLRAAILHLGLSALVAALVGWIVFSLWYPFPYREISGGSDLFLLVVSVDVVLGPLITFAVFNRTKPMRELRLDLLLVVLLQLAGLGYGLWTVYVARPVHMVFEFDRFRVVHHVDVPEELLLRVPAGIDPLPVTGPTPLAVRPFVSEKERFDATMAALQGVQVGARPDLWQPYEAARERVLAAAQPLTVLRQRFPAHVNEIDAALKSVGKAANQVVTLPLLSRKPQGWTVLLDARTAAVVGYLPIDSF